MGIKSIKPSVEKNFHPVHVCTQEKIFPVCEYFAWTDGSNDNYNPARPAGAAYVVLDAAGNEMHRASKGFLGKTNNFVEMIAIISAVAWIPAGSCVTVHSDSRYAINVFSGRWRAKANLNLVERYRQVSRGKKVIFKWVKGHSGIYWNEECDRMAKEEYQRKYYEVLNQ